MMDRYVGSLIKELERLEINSPPPTIFFGGGTPSLLSLAQWERLFLAFERLGLLGAMEWTVESNPATVSLAKARLWRSYGVNRVSMGVQSLDASLLDRLGRVHSREMVFKSYDLLRKAGFENLNLDLMFAIPGQTIEVWKNTIEEALAMQSEHLSCYEVIYEEDTPLFEQLKARHFEVNEDLACAMYDTLLDRATGYGFVQYEIANFARSQRGAEAKANAPVGKPDHEGMDAALAVDADLPRFACRHNVNYWRGGSYHGLGPSASGFIRGQRTKNVSNTQRYCELVEQGESPTEWTETLLPLARAGEIAAFGLRMNTGWSYGEFQCVTGFDLRQEWRGEMERLVSQGWGCQTAQRFHLSSVGMRFADAAAELFLR